MAGHDDAIIRFLRAHLQLFNMILDPVLIDLTAAGDVNCDEGSLDRIAFT